MDYQQYYNSLQKPFFAPPSDLFGIVWPFLYVIIIISFSWVAYQILIKRKWNTALLIPFVINVVANALYSPLFFNWKLPLLATVDIIVVLGTIIWIMHTMKNKAAWVSVSQIPYLTWVTFATILQISIVHKNWS